MKEKILKSVALAMCALILSLSVVNAGTIRVNAATVTHASLYKITDMALAKTGIVANSDIINSLISDIQADVQAVYDEFVTYCENLGIDIAEATAETWNDFITQCTDVATTIINEFPDMAGMVLWLCVNTLTVTMENIADYIIGAGTEGISQGVGYKISDEVVEYIKSQFDGLTENVYGYYYATVRKSSELPTTMFGDLTSWQNIKAYIECSDEPTIIFYCYDTNSRYTAYVFPHDFNVNFVRPYGDYQYVQMYDDNWDTATIPISSFYNDGTTVVCDDTTFNEHITREVTHTYFQTYPSTFTSTYKQYTYSIFMFSPTGGQQIFYTSLDAFKTYSTGQRPFYQVTTNDYSTTNDNSVEFTGDYYNSNSATYTYETVQNEIDNSTEINEETINNIVNTSTTTIINNYYTDSGGDNSGDSSGDSGSGLASLLEGIGGFLDFLLGLIGDVVSLLTTFLNSALTLIGSLGSLFGDFGALLGDLFVFIPQECIDAIEAGITLLIFVMIYKAFK